MQWKRTGSTGYRGISRSLGIVGLAGGISFIVAMVGGLVAPLLQLLRVVAPLRILNHGWVNDAGMALAACGLGATIYAQLDMGESWRVGIDTTETTTLVRTGTFGVVRNPIFAAMVVFTLGQTLLAPNPVAIAVFVIFFVAVEVSVRSAEEPYLLRVHGDDYRDYMAEVGRFVPGIGLRRQPSEKRSPPERPCTLKDPTDEIDRREHHPPRHPLPCGPVADKRDHGTASFHRRRVSTQKLRVQQLFVDRCAESGPCTSSPVDSAGPAASPGRTRANANPQYRWNDDIETAAERLVRRITDNLGHRVIPLPDNPVPIDRDSRPLILARPLHSVHTLDTTRAGSRFTIARACRRSATRPPMTVWDRIAAAVTHRRSWAVALLIVAAAGVFMALAGSNSGADKPPLLLPPSAESARAAELLKSFPGRGPCTGDSGGVPARRVSADAG